MSWAREMLYRVARMPAPPSQHDAVEADHTLLAIDLAKMAEADRERFLKWVEAGSLRRQVSRCVAGLAALPPDASRWVQ